MRLGVVVMRGDGRKGRSRRIELAEADARREQAAERRVDHRFRQQAMAHGAENMFGFLGVAADQVHAGT